MASSPRASAYVGALKLPVTVLCLFATALAAYYFLYVTLHRTYLVERNFRLLATLGEETAGLIQSTERVIQNLAQVDTSDLAPGRQNALVEDGSSTIRKNAAFFVPVLRTAVLAGGHDDPDSYIVRMFERGSRLAWEQRNDTAARGQKTGVVQLELQDVLDPLLRGETGKGIFDALLITEPDGRVVFQTGDEKLRLARLDRITQPGNAKAPEVTFQQLAHSPSMADVVLSGSQYVVFTQPCCVQMARTPPPATPVGEGWVLVGLVAGRTLSADSYAVSFSTLILLSALLTFALLSWPFLKLTFLGESQRVRVHDVLLVAICTLIGLSLLTIGALDYIAYDRHLQSTLDEQLTGLAGEVDRQAKDEIDKATDTLERLHDAVAVLPANDDANVAVATDPNLAHNAAVFSNDTLGAYPFFDSFALIDDDGQQKRKLTLGSVGRVTLLISTAEREYFRHWTTTSAAGKPFIESIRSNTTGAREAVISMPSTIDGYRVAALSIPLRSLINPVVVPGFGFAVINDEGRVLFHSDPRHKLSENFFVESDGNRRLRALVGARHSEFVDTQYWGNDYRALVHPMEIGQRWTLVAFYDKDLIRTVNVEWLILALMLLMMYVGFYVAISVGVLFVRPRYRAPWLWPDPTRSREYVDLLLPLLLLVAAFALAILTLPVTELVLAAWLLPLLAWVIVYDSLAQSAGDARPVWPIPIGCGALLALLILAHQSRDPVARVVLTAALVAAPALVALALWRRNHERPAGLTLPVNVSFGLMSAICIALTAVLPPAAFFKVGHALQLESFIKYGQLQVALDRIDKTQRDQQADAKDVDVLAYHDWSGQAVGALKSARSNGMNWGVYQSFFFDTKQEDSQICESGNPEADDDQSALDASAIPELLEERLPFYSESSVRLREMVHDRAADHSWSWRHRGSDIIFCAQSNAVIPFRSTVPRVFSNRPFDELITDRVIGLTLLVVVALALRWFVRFTLHKVFAIDVIEPFWSGNRRTIDPCHGQNLFLVNNEPNSLPPQAANYYQVDMAGAPDDPVAGAAWFGEQFDRLAQSESTQNVLVQHFEHRAQDPAFTEQKVALLERVMAALHRTVVVMSALPPGRFTLATPATPTAGAAATATAPPAWMPRWTQLMTKFTVVPVGPPIPPRPAPRISVTGWMTAGWRDVLWRLNVLGFAHDARLLDDEQRDAVVDRFWKEALLYAWLPDRPAVTVDQLLIEVGERSETHYREIWDGCTPAEKMVLGQIAEEGLVNEKTVRTVRALMSRGLVRRQPNFVVMNETFRQFVISTASHAEVAALEGQATSTWDAIRWPFMILLIGSLTFFFSTQHELYNSTLGILTGLAAALPALVKMASLFSDRPDRA